LPAAVFETESRVDAERMTGELTLIGPDVAAPNVGEPTVGNKTGRGPTGDDGGAVEL